VTNRTTKEGSVISICLASLALKKFKEKEIKKKNPLGKHKPPIQISLVI